MISGWLIIAISITYVGFLFAIAYWGDKSSRLYQSSITRGLVYSLSLAVYCTSWTFYGAVGRASNEGLGFLPIYLGPFLMILFGMPLIRRLVIMGKRQKTTSIADFIASRYGKSQILAIMITVIATIGIIPYIALQLKGIAMGYNLVTTGVHGTNLSAIPVNQDSAWYAAMFLAVFTVLFGTRHLDSTEHHQGMVQAVAFESIVKLIAFLAVGIYVCYVMFDSMDDIFTQVHQQSNLINFSLGGFDVTTMITQTIVAMFAIICLPRQFHVTVVENAHIDDLKMVRWLLPLYLFLISFFVLPIAGAGLLTFDGQQVDTDTFVLLLPISQDQTWLTILAFIGGSSAATAMVIVSAVTLSTMISNEIIIPAFLAILGDKVRKHKNLSHIILLIRRVAIIAVIMAAYAFYRAAGEKASLTAFGLLSFVAAAQFAPAIIGGLIWRRGNFQGAMIGLLVGFSVWFTTLLLPILAVPDTFIPAINQLGLQLPAEMSAINSGISHINQGTIWSLTLNLLCYVMFSLFTRQSIREKIQVATLFQEDNQPANVTHEQDWVGVASNEDIRAVSERFLGPEKTRSLFDYYETRFQTRLSAGKQATPEFLRYIETQLASVIGSSTAKVVLDSTLKGREMQIEDVVSIVDEANQVMQFNRDLLQSAIENIALGISVIDKSLKLVAWNQSYLDFFNYPPGFVKVGRKIEDLVRFNLNATNLSPDKVETLVKLRLEMIERGEKHEYERERPDGSVLLIQGTPTINGGFVTTFSDITRMRKTEIALKETNTYLEQRVKERTEELSKLNDKLSRATRLSEQANQSKTRFLASASHDLLQPLNAARLFTSALQPKIADAPEASSLLAHIDRSLNAAEEILSTLLDISKMDAGALEPQISDFCLNDILHPLSHEFGAIATDKRIQLETVFCSAVVRSDIQMLRRVIQNFLSNAIRYTDNGRVILGCRRSQQGIRIEVWDTGPGIPNDQLNHIFEEFKRLPQQGADKSGLGLGLAIVDRISHMLKHPVSVNSTQGKGSVFRITVPYGDASSINLKEDTNLTRPPGSLEGRVILCIDNDQSILQAMEALLRGWKCKVITASTLAEALTKTADTIPDIILADYQLDNNVNGLDLMDELKSQWHCQVPGVLITAVNTDDLKETTANRGYFFLNKPVKPAAVRALISTKLKKSS
jgi:Na+/proline symporter/signal transduction histidine kinase/CheY-like chemotaxis protein